MIKMQYWSFLYLGTTEWNVRSISEGNNFGKKCVILYKSNKSFFPQLTFSHLGIIKNRKWLVDEYNIYIQSKLHGWWFKLVDLYFIYTGNSHTGYFVYYIS